MHIDHLIDRRSDARVCKIDIKFNLTIIEYNPHFMKSQSHAFAIQSKYQKTTSWTWHLWLEHCRSDVINQLWKIEKIKIENKLISKTIECEICSLAKMHRIVQRKSSDRATRSFEILHFDLIIIDKRFDETACIAHFTDEHTTFNWIFSLIDHKEKTLLSIFKILINQCDRAGMTIHSLVAAICTRQKISIEKKLEAWMIDQNIKWQWSFIYISKQNEKSERHEVILIEKARCIRLHAKLPEKLFSECYLIAAYLLNRMSIVSLNWKSSLIFMKKFLHSHDNDSIRWKLFHLKIFECKNYSLKKLNAFSRSQKLKPRAFIDYLIDYDFTNIFRVWNLKKQTISNYRDVIFDERQFYDFYQKVELINDEKKKQLVEFVIYESWKSIVLDEDKQDYLDLSIRRRFQSSILSSFNQINQNSSEAENSSVTSTILFMTSITPSSQLSSPASTRYSASKSSTSDVSDEISSEKIVVKSKIESDDAEIPEFENITRRRQKFTKSKSTVISENLSPSALTSLNIIENTISSFVPSTNLNTVNIIEEKRSRKANSKYAGAVWTIDKKSKIFIIHSAFAAFAVDFFTAIQSLSILHQIELSNLSTRWRVMLWHSHAKRFMKTAIIKFHELMNKKTWEIIDEWKADNFVILFLKWIFIYKHDSNDFLEKYKTRLMMREDLQKIDRQNVYATILAFRVFRSLMTLVTAFGLKIRHLNAINVFFNVTNDDSIYCHMSNEWKIQKKLLKIIKILYEQRKFPLLWLRHLLKTCLDMKLFQIFDESCLYTNENDVFLWFYVDDIVIVYCPDMKYHMKQLTVHLMKTYKIRDLDKLKWFLEVRIIYQSEKIYLMSDSYIDKIAKEYEIATSLNTIKKLSKTSLSVLFILQQYDGELDYDRLHEFRRKMKFICYSTVMTRLDIAKAALKLIEFFINSSSDYLKAINHCLLYLVTTKFLEIDFSADEDEEFTIKTASITTISNISVSSTSQKKHVFEAIVNIAFADNSDRRSFEEYTFKLFDEMIDWTFRKQATILISTTEAELLACLHAENEILWWIHFFQKLQFNFDHDFILFNDNLQTIRLLNSKMSKMNTKLRHVDIVQCWLRQFVQLEHLTVNYLSTNFMISNDFTKLLSFQKHMKFIQQLSLINLKQKMKELRDMRTKEK